MKNNEKSKEKSLFTYEFVVGTLHKTAHDVVISR